MEMPIPGQIQHRPINHGRFAVPNNSGSKAQFPWKKGTFPAQKSPLSTLPIPIPSESSQSQVGGWKNHGFFWITANSSEPGGGNAPRAAPRKRWRLDELKSRGKNLFWGSTEPHPDRIHLNYCGILTFSKETEGAPIPQREFGRFCDVPGILGCFSLRCPREAAQDLCPSSSLQQNCSDQDFPSIHAASLAWISQDSHLSLCFVSQGFLLPLS